MQFLASELKEGENQKELSRFQVIPCPMEKLFPMVLALPAVPKQFLKRVRNWKDPLFVSREFLRSRKLIAQLIIKRVFPSCGIGLAKWSIQKKCLLF